MRIGVFGGSFDPIHNAHLIVALTARDALRLDQVRFVVAGEPQLKRPTATPGADRLAMVERAIAGLEGLVADRSEIDRPGPTWTVETLRALRGSHPDDELILLLGRDAALRLGDWREPDEVRRLARIAVCGRNGEPPPPGFDYFWTAPAMELSSTMIRARAAAGLPLAGWVPESVAGYISGLRLYGSGSG